MTRIGRVPRRIAAWAGAHSIYLALAVLAYIPPLLVRRGVISADNKVYLYLDPARMLSDSPYLWDPNVFAGTVPHQGVGYLFPVAPYYWLIHVLNIPIWVGQRIWLSTVVFLAGAGVVYLLRVLRWRGPGVFVAALAYMFTPYFLNYASAFTVIALPWTGLPWLLAFVMLAVRHRGWRYPAMYAVTIQLTGSVNASSLAFSLFASLLWLPFAVWLTREVPLGRAFRVLGRIGLLTLVTSVWWMSGLWAQSRYGIDVLKYSETARTVAEASSPAEILRGLGYWYFYGTDKLVPIVDSGKYYTGWLWLVGASFLVPAMCLMAAGIARFRERAYFVSIVFVGMIFAVGAYPWKSPPVVSGLIKWLLSSSQAGSAMRSLPRATPLVVLGLAVLLGAGVTALHEAARIRGIPRPSRWIRGMDRRVLGVTALVALLLIVNQPALFTGWFITKGISRPSTIPDYWKQAAKDLDAGDHQSRIWAIPGSNFASYRWNGRLVSSVDPILPGLTSRPFVAREQVPYGTYPSANLLIAADDPLQQNVLEPSALAPIARFLSVGSLLVRADDLAWVRYGTVRPNQVWKILRQAPGLGEPTVFGGKHPQHASPEYPMIDEATLAMGKMPDVPRLAVIPVEGAPDIVKTASAEHPVILAGDGSGLVDAAGAGLLSGRELVRYSGSMADDPAAMERERPGAALILTDSNRKRGQRWGTIQDTFGATERVGQEPLEDDPSDQRIDIFEDDGAENPDASRTVAVQRGGVVAQASSYGNPVTFTPESRGIYAVDAFGDTDNVNTAWTTAAFGPDKGEKLRLTFPAGVTSDHVTLLQPQTGRPDRWITSVKLTLDNGFTADYDLDRSSREEPGQTFDFPEQTFHEATIEITGDNVGHQYVYETASGVGFANVTFGSQTPRVTEYIELPRDLLGTFGTSSQANPLAIVLDRDRIDPFDALRSDPELNLARTWTLPSTRSFAISGSARLEGSASPAIIDTALGMPDAEHGGVDVSESRHLAGAADQRATAAIDGDRSTHWTTGFLSSVKDYAQYRTAQPVSFDHLDLTVVSDERHSVPTRLRVKVDGTTVNVEVPRITTTTPVGSTTTVRVPLGRTLTGSQVRFTITGERFRRTHDWYSSNDIDLPISLAEWGVDGLRADVPEPGAALPKSCSDKYLLVDNEPVELRLDGTVEDALSGRAISVHRCGSGVADGTKLDQGRHYLLSAPGSEVGFDMDQLVLRSGAGGKADPSTGTIVSDGASAGPKVRIDGQTRTSFDLTVTGADKPFWLVLGQSQSEGWKAEVDGRSIGGSELVDGYANGWKVDPSGDDTVHVELTWTPQRVIWVAIAVSGLAMILCLFLILKPVFRRTMAPLVDDAPRPGSNASSIPLPFVWKRAMSYRGAAPKMGVTVGVTLGAAVVGGLLIGLWAAPITGLATLVCLRFRRARPLLTIGAPACVLITGGYYVVFIAFRDTYLRFGWPSWFSRVALLGWFAVLALVVDTVVDRCWLRRWWPSTESEE